MIKQWLPLIIMTAVLLAFFGMLVFTPRAPIGLPPTTSPVYLSPSVVSTRPVTVYKLSVTPGGVWSIKEAGLRSGEVVTLKHDMQAYVSFKRNGVMYWTKKPVLIHAGEKIVTDGVTTIRARCGNFIKTTPQVPVDTDTVDGTIDEIDPPLDTPKLTQVNSGLLPPLEYVPPTYVTPSSPNKPTSGMPIAVCPGCVGYRPPTVSMPDAGEVPLLITAACLMGVALRRKI